MRVLYLTKYSRNGASSRLRSFQYFPLLKKEGIRITVKPFFDEKYLNDLYLGKKIPKSSLMKFYLNRFAVLFKIHKYDVIVIEKELFPYFFSWFEKILYLFNVKYVVDYDDAIFHNYDLNTNWLIRFLLKNKIKNVMKYSSCVLAGNYYLANKAKKSGAVKTIIFPTVIDVDKYKVKEYTAIRNTINIGWIGSPTTFKYLKNIAPTLSKLNTKYPFELHIIGASENLDFNGTLKYLKWSELNEADLISSLDIGIMPLENTPWELGKCSYKLIQYMGCGLPTVASAVGMNKQVIDHGINGFLVHNENDWIEKLGILINDANLRKQFGATGRKKIEQEFSLQHNIQTLIPLLKYGKSKQ
jgi:glycosyltransferase involved in cell wall biosynthesis